MNFSQLRDLFPSARTCVHLNHAGLGPIATPVADAVSGVLAEMQSDDTLSAYMAHMKRQERLRGLLGGMLSVDSQTIGFVRNTLHGLSIASQAIPLKPGDTIVVAENEYPSNVYPWQAQAHRGVTTRLVAPDENGWIDEARLISACDETTRILAVSWVQWGTGQRMDLSALGEFCRATGIWLVVDIVQGFGALKLDLSKTPVDIAVAGCHKWLMAPAGLGLMHVRADRMGELLPINIGWNSVENPIAWERLHLDELRANPQRFEEGSPALLATAALLASVELLAAVGVDEIEARVLSLANHAMSRLTEIGMDLYSRPGQSGIAAFRDPNRNNADVLAALNDAKVRAAVRAGNVRLSPHAYGTEDDIEAAIVAISAV